MSHANAALTPRARLRLAQLIVEDGWKPSVAAKMFMVSTVTARKWAVRFRTEGIAGMQDRSSRPRTYPHRTPAPVVAVGPFVGGHAVKGPTEQFCEHVGIEPSASGVAAAYDGLLRAEPPRAGDRPVVRGNRHAVALLKTWTDRAQGLGA